MFRVGKRSNWMMHIERELRRRDTSAESVARAARDLTPRADEIGLSVYKTNTEERAGRMALLFATTVRDRPRQLDYVLIPEQCMDGLEYTHSPSSIGAPELAEQHHEILGLHDREKRESLARRILSDDQSAFVRVREITLVTGASTLCKAEPDFRNIFSASWLNCLKL